MIDLTTERPLRLVEAARLDVLPRRPNGEPQTRDTLWRWSRIGVRGVRLETVTVGRSLCTTREALMRFIAASTRGVASTTQPTERQRARTADYITKRLAKLGIK